MNRAPKGTPFPANAGGGGGSPRLSPSVNCFAPETLVLMADHTTRRIDEVRIGDQVEGWDMEKDRPTTGLVTDVVRVRSDKPLLVNGLLCTEAHPFILEGGTTCKAGDIPQDQKVLTLSRGGHQTPTPTPLTVQRDQEYSGMFLNLHVQGSRNYLVAPGEYELPRAKTRRGGTETEVWHLVHD